MAIASHRSRSASGQVYAQVPINVARSSHASGAVPRAATADSSCHLWSTMLMAAFHASAPLPSSMVHLVILSPLVSWMVASQSVAVVVVSPRMLMLPCIDVQDSLVTHACPSLRSCPTAMVSFPSFLTTSLGSWKPVPEQVGPHL